MNQFNYTYTTCSNCHSVNKVNTDRLIEATSICGKCKSSLLFHRLVSEVDEIGLQKTIRKSDLPVIVDFWAPWCGPCKQFAPTFEVASEFSKGKMVYIKINTEKFQNVSTSFNIRGIPSLLIFKNGREIARESGAFPLDKLKNWVTKYY